MAPSSILAPPALRFKSWTPAAAVFALLALLALSGALIVGPKADFEMLYACGRYAGSAQLYSLDAAKQVVGETGSPYLRPNIRLPFESALLWPLAQLPYSAAQVLWTLLLVGSLAAFLFLWRSQPLAAALACLFFPLWIALIDGQDDLLILLLCAGALRLLQSKRGFRAGLLFALCAIKIQFLLLAPVLVFDKRFRRFCAGVETGGLVLLLLCFALQGPRWIGSYFASLSLDKSLLTDTSKMLGFIGMFADAPHAAVWAALGSVIIAGLVLRALLRADFRASLALVLAGGVLVSPHAYAYDAVLFLPALVLMAETVGPQVAIHASVALTSACLWIILNVFHPVHMAAQLLILALFIAFAGVVSAAPDPHPQPVRTAIGRRITAYFRPYPQHEPGVSADAHQ